MDNICTRARGYYDRVITRRGGNKILRFAIVGGSGAVISLTVLFLLTDVAGFHYLASYLVAGTLAITNNYIWHSRWTFKASNGLSGYVKYTVISWFTAGLGKGFILFVLTELGLWYMLSALIGTVIGFIVNYTLSRSVVWGR